MSDTGLTKQGQSRFHDPESRPDIATVGGDDRVLPPEVGTEQLIGTIEQVETHENDPTSESSVDPWTTFQDEFSTLGDKLKDTYRKVADDTGPSEDEIKDAFATLAGAWNQLAGSVSSALKDPDVRQHLKDAGSAFATAVGRTVSELGAELGEHVRSDRPDTEEE